MNKFIFTFSILTTCLFLSCSSSSNNEIRDIIQPIQLIAGITDTFVVSDLFYSEDYDLNFSTHPKLSFKFEKDSNRLILNANPDFEGMTLLDFELDGKQYSIPITSRIQTKVLFKFKPPKKYKKITLFGVFNNWNRENLPMKDDDGDGVYEIELMLDPASYQFKYWADGDEYLDENYPTVPNGLGGYNSLMTVEKTNKYNSFLHILEMKKDKDNKTSFYFVLETNIPNYTLSNKNLIALLNNSKISEDKIKIDGSKFEISFSEEELKNENYLRVAVTLNGVTSNIQTIVLKDGEPLGKKNEYFNWSDAIIYSLLIDRFSDGDKTLNNPVKHDSLFEIANYMGGDFQGIINKLNEGYFDSLGINVLWLSPVYENPNTAFKESPYPYRYYSGYHGYWPINPRGVEEHFGTMEKLKELIDIAHKHNIKILFDFVANHVHQEHPYYKEHPEWFGTYLLPDGSKNLRLWDTHRLTTWFEPYIPSFDYIGSKEALEQMTDDAIWWFKELNLDGFRQDAVKHVPNEFWRRLTQKLKQEIATPQNKRIYQIGETFGSYELISSYVNNGQLDAQYNFNLFDRAISVFLRPQESFASLDEEMKTTFSVYGYNHLMGNIMDSHDKVRFLAYADGDVSIDGGQNTKEIGWTNPPKVDNIESYEKAKLYLAYLVSIPGVPIIYYGTESGISGAEDPDNRRMMKFLDEVNENEKQMYFAVKRLIHLRKNHSALRYGDFYTLQADKNIYAFIRSDINERILIVLNKSKNWQSISLNIPAIYEIKTILDLVSNKEFTCKNNSVQITIASTSWKMFKLLK